MIGARKTPSREMPKYQMKSWMRSGVPFRIWTYTPASMRTRREREMRQSAIAAPRSPPPTKAISDRIIVHSAAWSRKSTSCQVKCRMPIESAPRAETALAREGQHGEHGEAAAQQEGEAEIDCGADEID